MIPGPWESVVLALAVYRLCRVLGWDTMPWLVRARAWATGETVTNHASSNTRMGLTPEAVKYDVRYIHPRVAEFLGCPFCTGAWLALLTYLAWRWWPNVTLTGAFPLAVSATAGLLAKNLDP